MTNHKNFTVYSSKDAAPPGYVNTTIVTDEHGSTYYLFKSIALLYDKPPSEKQILAGTDNFTNETYTQKGPTSLVIQYSKYQNNFFFPNGSIYAETINFNETPLLQQPPITFTILYGTGDYLGAQGFVYCTGKADQTPDGRQVFTSKLDFIFTN